MKIRAILTTLLLLPLILAGCGDEETPVCSIDWSVEPVWDLDTLAIAQEVAVNGIWGVNHNEVYAVGTVDSGQGPIGIVWKYDGTGWSEFYTRPNTELRDIHGVSAQSLWIAGFGDPVGSWAGALVLHWNGSTWEETLLDPSVAGLLAIWAGDDQNVYAIDRRHGVIMHFDGTTWAEEDTPVQDDPPHGMADRADLWGLRERNDLIVYAGLTMGRGSDGVILRKSAGVWEIDLLIQRSGYSSRFVGVWGASEGQAYAVEQTGRGAVPYGIVFHREDTGWAVASLGWIAGLFQGVRGGPEGSVFVLGGVIYLLHAGTWTEYRDYPGFPYHLNNDAWIDGHHVMFARSHGDFGGVLMADFAVSCQDPD